MHKTVINSKFYLASILSIGLCLGCGSDVAPAQEANPAFSFLQFAKKPETEAEARVLEVLRKDQAQQGIYVQPIDELIPSATSGEAGLSYEQTVLEFAGPTGLATYLGLGPEQAPKKFPILPNQIISGASILFKNDLLFFIFEPAVPRIAQIKALVEELPLDVLFKNNFTIIVAEESSHTSQISRGGVYLDGNKHMPRYLIP